MFRKLGQLEPYALSIMRMVVGFTFTCHGSQKWLGWLSPRGAVPFGALPWFAGVIETFGGLLIILGLFTAPVAFILCGEMAVAYFRQHAPRGMWPLTNGGELAVLYCFIYLHLAARGGGAWSLDRLLRKSAP